MAILPATFPASAACFRYDGFALEQPVATRYLGYKSFTDYASIKGSIIITNDADFQTWSQWWWDETTTGVTPNEAYDGLAGGVNAFNINLAIHGTAKTYTVKFANNMQLTIEDDMYILQAVLSLQHPMNDAVPVV